MPEPLRQGCLVGVTREVEPARDPRCHRRDRERHRQSQRSIDADEHDDGPERRFGGRVERDAFGEREPQAEEEREAKVIYFR